MASGTGCANCPGGGDPVPIRLRLALLFAAASLVALTIGGVAFVHVLNRSLLRSVDNGLGVRADALVQAIGPDSNVDFQDSGPSALIRPGEAIAQVIRPDGTVAESSTGAGSSALLQPAQITAARLGALRATIAGPDGTGSIRALAVAVPRADGIWIAIAATSIQANTEAESRVRWGLMVAGLPAVVLAGFGAWLLAGAALRPVERMRGQAEGMSVADNHARLVVPGTRDELAALARTMNDLLGRLRAGVDHERELVADASHELRTPLSILRAELELAQRPGRTSLEIDAALGNAIDETDRLTRLADDLVTLAAADCGSDPFRAEAFAIGEVLDRAMVAAGAAAAQAGVHLSLSADRPGWVSADPDRIRQAVDNLIANAMRHAPPGSTIDVAAKPSRIGTIDVTVSDRGPGFPEAFLPQAFDRFRRADAVRGRKTGGSGLGLAIVRSIAEAHGGRAWVTNRPGGGAEAGFSVPTHSEPDLRPIPDRQATRP